MSQAKCLYVVSLRPGIGMSALAEQLDVGLSSASGLVDRLVEHGYLERHEDPADRRQQQVARDGRPARPSWSASGSSMPSSCGGSWRGSTDHRARLASRAAWPPSTARPEPSTRPTSTPTCREPRKDDRMIRLTQFALREKSRHDPARGGHLPGRHLLVGPAAPGAHPGHRAALRDGHHAAAGRRRRGRRQPGHGAGRALAGQRPAPGDDAVDVLQLALARLRPVRLRDGPQGDHRQRRGGRRRRPSCPRAVEPQVSSFDFNSQPIIVATVGPVEGADPVEAAAITRDEVVPALLGIEGVSTAELTGGATPILDIVLDPAKMAEHGISLQQVQGILFANQITIPSGVHRRGQPAPARLHGAPLRLHRGAGEPDRGRQRASRRHAARRPRACRAAGARRAAGRRCQPHRRSAGPGRRSDAAEPGRPRVTPRAACSCPTWASSARPWPPSPCPSRWARSPPSRSATSTPAATPARTASPR